jgi:hypothetical protein
MLPVHWILVVVLVVGSLVGRANHAQTPAPIETYAAAVPAELLDHFDPRILAGTAPTVATISRHMIGSLGGDPDHSADVYRFDFPMRAITPAQRAGIAAWIARGNDVLLWGYGACLEFDGMFDAVTVGTFKPPGFIWSSHAVNTGVDPFKFGSGGVGFYVPSSSDIIYGKEAAGGEYDIAFAGRVVVGDGNIVFACLNTEGSSLANNDYRRWFLNFHQWVMGLPVPGAASPNPP